ncbi:MAG: hypothetical protein PHT40_01385 [Patescibacteria group bacterium]|nr:hypothetical protein [Patescibacteria group bacterium]
MATVFNLTSLEEGWNLCGHHLRNLLGAIKTAKKEMLEVGSEEENNRERCVFEDSLLKLIGILFVIQRHMLKNEHWEEAAKMGYIVKMVTELNSSSDGDIDGAIAAILKKFDESRSGSN